MNAARPCTADGERIPAVDAGRPGETGGGAGRLLRAGDRLKGAGVHSGAVCLFFPAEYQRPCPGDHHPERKISVDGRGDHLRISVRRQQRGADGDDGGGHSEKRPAAADQGAAGSGCGIAAASPARTRDNGP